MHRSGARLWIYWRSLPACPTSVCKKSTILRCKLCACMTVRCVCQDALDILHGLNLSEQAADLEQGVSVELMDRLVELAPPGRLHMLVPILEAELPKVREHLLEVVKEEEAEKVEEKRQEEEVRGLMHAREGCHCGF